MVYDYRKANTRLATLCFTVFLQLNNLPACKHPDLLLPLIMLKKLCYSLLLYDTRKQIEQLCLSCSYVCSDPCMIFNIIFFMCVHFRMTKPKFRPCPICQVHQQANRKTCSACFATLPSKRLLKTEKINDDWGQRVIKNKNASRVVASAQIAVSKNAHALFIQWQSILSPKYTQYLVLCLLMDRRHSSHALCCV